MVSILRHVIDTGCAALDLSTHTMPGTGPQTRCYYNTLSPDELCLLAYHIICGLPQLHCMLPGEGPLQVPSAQ